MFGIDCNLDWDHPRRFDTVVDLEIKGVDILASGVVGNEQCRTFLAWTWQTLKDITCVCFAIFGFEVKVSTIEPETRDVAETRLLHH